MGGCPARSSTPWPAFWGPWYPGCEDPKGRNADVLGGVPVVRCRAVGL